MRCASRTLRLRAWLSAAVVAAAGACVPVEALASEGRSSTATVQRPGIPCVSLLDSLQGEAAHDCLRRIEVAEALDVHARARLAALLERSIGTTDHLVIVAALDAVRAHAGNAADLAETLSGLLPHQAAIYQGRDKWQVLRLRAYLFVTLSEIGLPDSALPLLVDALAYVDERMSAVQFGAAVRAVGRLGPRGRSFAPYLLRTLGERFAEEEFSLDRYDYRFPREEATTVQIETMRALAAIGHHDDNEVIAALGTIARNDGQAALDPRMVEAAAEALGDIEARRGVASPEGLKPVAVPLVTPWIESLLRRPLQNLDISLTDHDGRDSVLRDLVDRPALMTFFYSRCQNAGKCSTTVSKLALLQRDLARRGIYRRVRLLAVTFEPQYDTPNRLKRYAADRGLDLDTQALAVRLNPAQQPRLMEELKTPVSYSAGWVNSHGVQAVLLDSRGRLVRKYVNLSWDNTLVVDDFQRLLARR